MTQTAHRPWSPRIAVPCAHPGCRHLAATVTLHDGLLTVEIVGKHHGDAHRTLLTVCDLDDKLQLTTAFSPE